MNISYEEHKAAYDAAFARAQAEKSCFCWCGCAEPVEGLTLVLGLPVICGDCRKSGKSHGLTRRPVETYDWDAWEAANPSPERVEAETYARAVGASSGPRLRSMWEKVSQGLGLTDAEVEQALRSKAADKRADEQAAKRLSRSTKRAAKRGDVDLSRIYIGPEVEDGEYAVVDEAAGPVRLTVERPTKGLVAGWTTVTFTVGLAEPEYGFQRPQPQGRQNFYSGPYAHLVHALVSNPGDAKSLFASMEEMAA